MRIGTIHLEGMMHRCGILSSIGYRFNGTIDPERLKESFISVVSQIKKFQHPIFLDAKQRIVWKQAEPRTAGFRTVTSDDPLVEFSNVCADIFNEYRRNGDFPLLMTLIRPNDKSANTDHIVVQTMNHAYCDARSCESIFSYVIDYYNALADQNRDKQENIIRSVKNLTTPGGNELYSPFKRRSLMQLPLRHHLKNLLAIVRYKISDGGGYSIPFDHIEKNLPLYRQKERRPALHWYDINPLITHCQNQYPRLNSNSIICALVAKSIYRLNQSRENAANEHSVSFRMLADVLTPKMRKRYIGNYIAYVPVTVDARLSVSEISRNIDDWVTEFKNKKLDLSQFKFLEFAIAKRLVGKADDPVSYSISQVNHRALAKGKQTLKGAQFNDIIGGINAEPLDLMGAMMNNKPVICTSLSEQNRLFVTFYPAIGSDDTAAQIADAIELTLYELNSQ